jgi:polyhydroxybutyrate depolymerase
MRRLGGVAGAGARSALAALLLLAPLAAGCTQQSEAALPPACTGDEPPPAAGTTTVTLDVDGVERSYLLAVPELVSSGATNPALFVFSGPEADPTAMLAATQLADLASDRGVVLVAPQPSAPASPWAIPGVPGADDVRFTEAVLYDLGRRVCVAAERIYAAGFDNGAAFAMWLTCALPRFAGVAPVAGANLVRPCEGPGVSVVAFHDNDDQVVPFTPPEGYDTTSTAGYLGDLIADMAVWADRAGCAEGYTVEQLNDAAARVAWPQCRDGRVVVLYSVTGVGHDWPGGTVPLSAGAAPGDPLQPGEEGGIVTDVAGGVDASVVLLDSLVGATQS